MFGFIKSPIIQFLINPSTIFIISGMLAAKYRDDPVETGFASPDIDHFNSSMSNFLANGLEERNERQNSSSHSLLESYDLVDPMVALEMRLISLMIQGYDNSTQWQIKFVDLPKSTEKLSLSSTSFQRKANVLITDPQEAVPVWVVVNLSTLKVESWTKGKSSSGRISEDDKIIAAEVALADANVQEKIKALGDKGVYEVVPEVWDAGLISNNPNEKLVQIYFYGLRKEDGEPAAYPFDFVTYVETGRNVVRGIEDLPLHSNLPTKSDDSMSTPDSNFQFDSDAFPPPNTVRSELYRFNGSYNKHFLRSSLQMSGSEELHR